MKHKNNMTTVGYGIAQALRWYTLFYSTINLKHREGQINACTHIYFEQYIFIIWFCPYDFVELKLTSKFNLDELLEENSFST